MFLSEVKIYDRRSIERLHCHAFHSSLTMHFDWEQAQAGLAPTCFDSSQPRNEHPLRPNTSISSNERVTGVESDACWLKLGWQTTVSFPNPNPNPNIPLRINSQSEHQHCIPWIICEEFQLRRSRGCCCCCRRRGGLGFPRFGSRLLLGFWSWVWFRI